MQTIEIDFDVFKELTLRRQTEEESYNDVLRDLLGLAPAKIQKTNSSEGIHSNKNPWVCKGVMFPHGTEFRSVYKGKEYRGLINDGKLIVEGKAFSSPSAAAGSITGNQVNGWIFWECRRPGEVEWRKIQLLK